MELCQHCMANIPMIRISKASDSALLYTKSIIINLNNNNLSVLCMVNEFNNSLKSNYRLDKLRIKGGLFKRVDSSCFIKIFLNRTGCIED